MIQILIFSALAMQSLALKCYAPGPSPASPPIRFDQDIPGAQFCVRYDYKEQNAPIATTMYAPVKDQQSVDYLKAMGSNVYACNTDFCNGPDAPASGTPVKSPTPEPPVASPIVSPKASPTALVKSGADRVMDRSVFTFMFALLFVVY